MKLPDWADELRPHQSVAINNVLHDFAEGYDVVFLEAPTGSGKTLIAEMVRQELGCRGLYSCSSLSLQQQFQSDFPSAAVLMGRGNYPTLDHESRYRPSNPTISLSCADCTKRKTGGGSDWICDWCSPVQDCPYESAKVAALRADLVCVNAHYFLYEANYVGTMRGRDLVVVDEVDTLENTLMSFIEVNISDVRVKEFKLPTPDKKTVASTWLPWAQDALAAALKNPQHHEQLQLLDNVPDLSKIKQKKRLDNLISDLKRLLDPTWGLASDNWIYDGYREGHIIFKPITVAPYAKEFLWRHGKKWLMMSATIISTSELAGSLGL